MCNGRKPNGDFCGRKYGLDKAGFCDQHRPGAPRCHGRNKGGEPCGVKGNRVDATGYCDRHRQGAPRCRGFNKGGEPCGVKGNKVDAAGYCDQHRPGAPCCRGFNKGGEPCGVKGDKVSAAGYCGKHGPDAPRCRGRSKDGSPCDIKGDEDVSKAGYCNYHKNQASGPEPYVPAYDDVRCLATASSTNDRCRKDWQVKHNQYCIYHQDQAPIKTKISKPNTDTQRAAQAWAARVDQRRSRSDNP